MSRGHSGNFREKHPPGTQIDSKIMQRVAENVINGSLTCKAAHKIATVLCVPPIQVGTAIDLQNGRIKACQLGLFGYGETKKVATGKTEISEHLKAALAEAANDNRITCLSAWNVAQSEGVTHIEVGRACEVLGIKVKQCQLGAF